MTAKVLRQKYLDFFKSKGHTIIPSASLVPDNDPSVLFTTAGMHPLVPYLLGENHPGGTRVTNVQKCIRTVDIDEVGDTTHHTFFEMLGNWSFGDYFKKEAIEWSWEFLTSSEWLGRDKNRIAVSVFAGDDDAPFDEDAYGIWKKIFEENNLPVERIAKLPKVNNWWGMETGPCGPDSEMFYWVGDSDKVPKSFNDDNNLWVEIWNDVFMEYERKKRVLLIDGMHFLYDKKFMLNEALLTKLLSFNAQKILVVNGCREEAEKLLNQYGFEVFSFDGEINKDNQQFFLKLLEKYNLKPQEIIYFDHSEANVSTAKKVGINLSLVSDGDIAEVSEFINKNLYYLDKLKKKNVDTGMGMERVLASMNGFDDNYRTELFWPIIEKIEEISGKKYDDHKKEFRIIADHIKAGVFIISDGVVPSNVQRGYVLRRLIRRAIRHGKTLGIESDFTKQTAEIAVEIYRDFYKELDINKNIIFEELEKEESKFKETLEKGLKKIEKYLSNPEGNFFYEKMGGEFGRREMFFYTDAAELIFDLYQTDGFPLEMSLEELKKAEVPFDEKRLKENFNILLQKHQEKSRTASAGMFKGGLADSSEETTKLHTAAHLLLQALRQVLGDHVVQKGSNITAERLRFDFSHPEKMTDDEKKKVEEIVNDEIQKKLPVKCEEMSLEEAKEKGAMGVFESKYGEKVKVYTVGAGDDIFSKEICGGPHVENIGELGHFKIKKEESSSAGVRRIKAVLE